MVKDYLLQKTNSKNYNYVVISKSWYRLDDYIGQVQADLKKKAFQGFVIFDCLLSNAGENRFLSAFFNGSNFDFQSFKKENDVDSDIINSTNKVYTKHIEWIDSNPILSDSQKFLFKRELSSAKKHKLQRA